MANEGDLVLVHVENSPAFFARIECIAPDVKPDWFQVTLLVLQVPLVQVTWILRKSYIDGASFTMGGKNVMIEPVVAPPKEPPPVQERKIEKAERKQPVAHQEKGKVISLFTKK